MPPPPIRLGMLARVLDRTGRIALRDGVELRRLVLTVPVSQVPAFDPVQLWRTPVARGPQHAWARWLAALGRSLGLIRPPHWPQVRLVWEGGTVFAELEPDRPANPALNQGD